MIKECIKKLSLGEDLSFGLATSAMENIMSGDATQAQIGAFITALSVKGETPDEIAGMAKVMRSKSYQVKCDYPVIDTCGTGGDGSNSFNISTASAFVVAMACNKSSGRLTTDIPLPPPPPEALIRIG